MQNGTINIYALDEDFQLVTTGIPYVNLQWNRKYYEAGDFAVQVSLDIYDESWEYIGTSERPELGMVQKIEITGEGDTYVLISGFFCEKMLDDKVCYPRYVGDYSTTEAAVRNIFNEYKEDLPITLAQANNPLLGESVQLDFTDDFLGTKIYSILEPREMTYSVIYDYVNNKLKLKVWQGLDRTQSQSVNSPSVFSTAFGNLTDKNVNIDYSAYRNYAIVPVDANEDGIESRSYSLDRSNGGYKKVIVLDRRSSRPEEGQSEADFMKQILDEAAEDMEAYDIIEDIDVQVAGNDGYMTSYDIGDKCDVLLTDINYETETRIVEVFEVFKADGGHTATIGLGNKRISNIRRAIL